MHVGRAGNGGLNLAQPRSCQVAGRLGRKVIVAGGQLDGEGYTGSSELFDGEGEDKAQFTPGPPMHEKRWGAAAAVMGQSVSASSCQFETTVAELAPL